MSYTPLEQDAITLCQEMIRIPSVNFGDGKGNEREIADYVVAKLLEVGISSQIYESAPGRCNVVAKIEGSDTGRPGLVVHGHLDLSLIHISEPTRPY